MHRKGPQATVKFMLKVRGVNVLASTQKIEKFRFGEYCTFYRSNPYAWPGNRVLGAEGKAFLEGALATEDFP